MHYVIPCVLFFLYALSLNFLPHIAKKVLKHQHAEATTVELYHLLITRIMSQPLLIKYEKNPPKQKFTKVMESQVGCAPIPIYRPE